MSLQFGGGMQQAEAAAVLLLPMVLASFDVKMVLSVKVKCYCCIALSVLLYICYS